MKTVLFVSVLFLSSCSVLDIFTSPEPERIVCEVNTPQLPMPNEEGNVVLEPEDQSKLLIYIEELEYCIELLS